MKKLSCFIAGSLSVLIALPVIDLLVQNLELMSEKIKAKNTIEISKANIEIAKLQESIRKTDSFAVGYDMSESSEEEYYDDDDDDDEDYIEEDKISCKNKIGFIG